MHGPWIFLLLGRCDAYRAVLRLNLARSRSRACIFQSELDDVHIGDDLLVGQQDRPCFICLLGPIAGFNHCIDPDRADVVTGGKGKSVDSRNTVSDFEPGSIVVFIRIVDNQLTILGDQVWRLLKCRFRVMPLPRTGGQCFLAHTLISFRCLH